MSEQLSGPLVLGYGDLLLAAALVLVGGLISVALRLGLEKKLAIASIRTVVQLLLVGYILKWVFALESAPVVLGVAGIMIAVAGHTAVTRPARTFRGAFWWAFVALVVSGIATSYAVTGAIIDVEPWWEPRYLLPLLGMILGNGLTGISLALDSLLEHLKERKDEVEMELAHGATRWEAALPPIQSAVRRGMIPITNAMLVVGIVSLPGMMTGQIIAGADPIVAVKYQIVVMFMLVAATSMGCILLALSVYKVLFNERHQLRSERILTRGGEG